MSAAGLSVAQLVSSGGFYGAERVVVELGAYLREQGHDCRILALQSPGAQALCAAAAAQDVPARIVPCRGNLDPAAWRRLHRLLRDEGVQIAHSHGFRADVWLRIAAPRGTVRIATAHTWYSNTAALRAYEFLDKLCLRGFDHVVAVAPELLEVLQAAGIDPARTSMIENGLSLPPLSAADAPARIRRELGVAAQDALLLRVGRLDVFKGNHVLLQAYAGLGPAAASTRLVLVGDGPERAALERQARAAGLQERVIFAGYRPDVADLLRAADLFVIASLQEGLPMVLLEAMAAGVPVVTTRVGAIGGVIRGGENGWIVPAGDAAALGGALREALGDAARRRRCAEQALQDYAREHSRAAMGAKYLARYRRLVAAGT